MNMKMLRFLTGAILVSAVTASYDGFKVYNVSTTTSAQNSLLLSLKDNRNLDFWTSINKVGAPVDIMVAPQAQSQFETLLKASKISFDVLIPDVEKVIEEERVQLAQRRSLKPAKGRITFDQYYQHAEINAYLDQLAEDYPDLVTVISLGLTYEGRDQKAVRISAGPSDPPKPEIFIDAAIHAREWIAAAVALYTINQIVENPENRYLLEDVDWVILPVLNADGYAYTFTNDRLWRKTVSPSILCDGTDANRNFDFHWRENNGASSFACAQDYSGPIPFSEIEARNVRDFFLGSDNVTAYISFHSYGQWILYPYGHNGENPENVADLDDAGNRIRAAIAAVAGTSYAVGNSAKLLYVTAGASVDWALGVGGVPLTYTIELPAGGSGNNGFIIPPERIRPIVIETFEGVKALHDYVTA